jgi:hypothetical protein
MAIDYFAKAKESAKARGGELLDKVYLNARHKMKWQCKSKHIWEAAYYSVVGVGSWCAQCQQESWDLKKVQAFVKKAGIKALSKVYTNMQVLMDWQCVPCGHKWRTNFNPIKRGSGCPKCAGNMKKDISDIQAAAKAMGGVLLSKRYVGINKKHKFACKKGHEFSMVPSSLINAGNWCGRCAGNFPITVADAKRVAKANGHKLISTVIENARERLDWLCKCGEPRKATYGDVEAGKVCRKCAGNAEHTIEALAKKAKARGGKLISKTYLGARENLTWECSLGDRWDAAPSSVLKGSWCPQCSSGLSENKCRAAMEDIFGYQFPKHKDDSLRNRKTGRKMELDGFCAELKLTFEHHGILHFTQVKHFGKGKDLADIQRRDAAKTAWCKKSGITQIIFIRLDLAKDAEAYLKKIIKKVLKKERPDLLKKFDVDRTVLDLDRAYRGYNKYKSGRFAEKKTA